MPETVQIPIGVDWILDQIDALVKAGQISAADAWRWLDLLGSETGFVPIGAVQYQPGTPEWREAVQRAYTEGRVGVDLIPTQDYYRTKIMAYEAETNRLRAQADIWAEAGRQALQAGDLELGYARLRQAAALENASMQLQAAIANQQAAVRLAEARLDAATRGYSVVANALGTLAGIQAEYSNQALQRARMLAELAANPTNWVAEAYAMRGATPPGVAPSAWQAAMSGLLEWQGAPQWLTNMLPQLAQQVLAGPAAVRLPDVGGVPQVSAPQVDVSQFETPAWLREFITTRTQQAAQMPSTEQVPSAMPTRTAYGGFTVTPEGYIADPTTGRPLLFEVLEPGGTSWRRQHLTPAEFGWLWQNVPGGFREVTQ